MPRGSMPPMAARHSMLPPTGTRPPAVQPAYSRKYARQGSTVVRRAPSYAQARPQEIKGMRSKARVSFLIPSHGEDMNEWEDNRVVPDAVSAAGGLLALLAEQASACLQHVLSSLRHDWLHMSRVPAPAGFSR